MSEGLFLQSDRMESEKAGRESLEHPMGWPLGPTDETRPLNIGAEIKWALQFSYDFKV